MKHPWFVFLCFLALGGAVAVGVLSLIQPRHADPLSQEMRRIAAQVERSKAAPERE